MTSNQIQVTEGAGKSVATETISSVDYQQVKLINGLAGSTTPITATAGALDVNLKSGASSVSGTISVSSIIGSLPAGIALIGHVITDSGSVSSVSGTVGASVIGTVPVTMGGAWVASVSGSVGIVGNPSISGTVGASIIGLTPVAVTNIPSISGTVGASIIGSVPVTFVNSSISGTVNVTGTPSVSGTLNIASIFGAISPYAQPDSFVSGSPSVMTTTASVLVLAAPSGTLRNYITHILATNAGAVATTINIVDNGQVIYSGYAAASGGGYSATLPTPLRQPTSALGLFAGSTTTSSVIVAITGFKAN